MKVQILFVFYFTLLKNMKIAIVIFVVSASGFTPGVGNNITGASSKKEVEKEFKPVPQPSDTFSTIQRDGFRLVDKSNFIRKLLDEGDGSMHVYLLTRPRRFGKTVFVSMLEAFFEGRKELFNDTEIQSRGNNLVEDGGWRPYPVIRVDFLGMCGTSKAKDFISKLRGRLRRIAIKNELPTCDGEVWSISDLIEDLYRKTGLLVSVLIDDYDDVFMKPNMPETEKSKIMDYLTSFYSGIKVRSSMLRMVFITGVSRLNKIHRAWNGFVNDITHAKDYWSIIGFTWEEVKINFNRNIAVFANDTGMPTDDIEEQLPKLYGMYKFNDEERTGLLIPGSLCQSLRGKKLNVYLPSTPAFDYVVEQMLKRNLTVDEFKYVEVPRTYLESNFLVPRMNEQIPLEIYMWFNGFLTIKKRTSRRDNTLELTYSCQEIEDTFREAISNVHRPLSQYSNRTLISVVHNALLSNDFQTVVDCVNEHAFPTVTFNKKLGTPEEEEFVATHQMYTIFRSVFQVKIEEGKKIFRLESGTTAGDIDLFIPRFQEGGTSYAVSIKYGRNAVIALFAYIVYVVENPVTFRSATGCTDSILLGWNVQRDKNTLQRRIGDWVAVPYREGKIWLNELETYFTNSSEKVLVLQDLMSRIQNRSTNRMLYPRFVPDDIIIRPNETIL